MGIVIEATKIEQARKTARHTENLVRLQQGRPTVEEERKERATAALVLIVTVLFIFPGRLVIDLVKAIPQAAREARDFRRDLVIMREHGGKRSVVTFRKGA